MATPTVSDVHVNAPLTNISVAYIQQATNFIADRVFPMVPVSKQSDRFYVYDKSYWFRSESQERAPATESAGSGWVVDNTPTYYTRIYSIHKDIDDYIRANADTVIDMDRDATEYVTQQNLLKKEIVWANSYFRSGVWNTNLTGVASAPGANQFLQWDQPNSTPIEDITYRITMVAGMTGYKPNKLVLSPHVFDALKNHPDILDRIKYTQRGVVTRDILAGLLEVEEVLVPYAVVNTAPEGAAENTGFIYGKNALLVYSNPRPSLLTPSGGYIFAWTGLFGAGAFGNRIKRFRMEHLASDRIEGEQAFDCKLVAPDLGVFFGNAVS